MTAGRTCRTRSRVSSPVMAPTDWTASSPEEFEKLQSELRALTEDDRSALDELGKAIASIKAAEPVTDRDEWNLPEYARNNIWAAVESYMNGGAGIVDQSPNET